MLKQYSIDVIPEEDGMGFFTIVPALPGCFSQGASIEEAIRNTRQAIRLHVKMLRKKKLPIPEEGLTLQSSNDCLNSIGDRNPL
ncbi:MAG: type II toxin-antitoxin system HicB family antitoxin [Deltaproteobacteria bacterium]|nr:type II toxin-antitoxin system HicB family antitoxin [Deltaproteobacteria bacterium]